MKQKIFKLCSFYILIILCMLFMSFIDFEFNISVSAFLTFIFFSLCILSIFIYNEYIQDKKEKQKQALLLEQISHQHFIDLDEVEEPYLKALLIQNQDLQNNFLRLNEQQIKWIHDIKLPLATLQLFIQNNKATLSFENRKTLELISLNFDQLIEQKLMLDKVIHNIDDLVVEKLNLYESIASILKKLAPLIQLKDIKLLLDIDKTLMITSDKKSLRYCFEQILSNAIKYSVEKGNIQIKTVVEDDKVSLFVIDDGLGIDSQDIHHIFEYGYTGKNGINNTKNASSGVGLFMVNQTLTRLHHTIQIFSEDKKGTTVKITF